MCWSPTGLGSAGALAFLPRDPGRAYSPPIRLLSRLGVGDLEERTLNGRSRPAASQRR